MTTENGTPRPVRQLRLVVETEDYDAALTFYRDVLGLVEREVISSEGDARITVLEAGRATLELSNPAQVRMIDQVEAGGRPSAKIRVAFEVEDAETATRALVEAGGTLLAEPRETPWRSLNSRLSGPAGLQITLFQELDRPQSRPRIHAPAQTLRLRPRTPPEPAAPRRSLRPAWAQDGGGRARSAPGWAAAAE
jgi:predicted enzyme related to lactoylglutathione lyase